MAPNFSAFTTPSKVIAEASAQGVKALGISSFFDQQVYRRFADEARAAGIVPLFGPLWSDPERGLFVQYLRAGKVPGATTVDDVRRFYEAKVPMGRGCLPLDVARAITYIVEQAYETGQAVPVTGGQNMLS